MIKRKGWIIMSKKITVLGGDVRQVTVGKMLLKDGYDVCMYGFDDEYMWHGAKCADSLQTAVCDADYIILGLPSSFDNTLINTSCKSLKLYIDDLINAMDNKSVVIGGKISPKLHELFSLSNIKAVDYFEREELIVQNAIPTAEGAIGIAMQELPHTIFGSRCLVTGYGRIGKVLAKMLSGLGAEVTCSARKHSDFAWIGANGHFSANTSDLTGIIHEFQVIFNTIPHKIFDRDLLKNMRSDVLLIDLASKPGGVDFEAARSLGVKVIWALSLPGKVAPVTAGKIIKDTIVNIISEL